MKKGICKRTNPFRGMTTVSDKGQIVVPADLRTELSIKRGEKLIVLKRKDNKGFTCLKETVLDSSFKKLVEK